MTINRKYDGDEGIVSVSISPVRNTATRSVSVYSHTTPKENEPDVMSDTLCSL